MVAVVSGSGLGLFTGTGLSGNGQVGRGRDQIIVNTTTGNLVVQSVDETLSALGLDFAGIRTYNSQGLTDEDNNDNWRLGVHQRLLNIPATPNSVGSTITKVFGDGAEVIYTWNATRSRYESNDGDGANDFLTWDSANSRWTWTDGSSRATETYESVSGVYRIRTSRDADLNTVTYNYTGSLLTNIAMAGSTSQQVFFEYTGTNLTAIRVESNGAANAQTLTRYRYDALNRLQQVIVDLTPKVAGAITTDVNGDQLLEGVNGESYVTTYTYEGNSKRVASIAQSDGSSVSFTYVNVNGDYRLSTVRDAENRTTTFNYFDVTGGGGGSPVNAPAAASQISTTDTVNYPTVAGALTASPAGWNNAALRETASPSINDPRIRFDANGNGFLIWRTGNNIVSQRYTRATNSWGPEVILDSRTTSTSAQSLSVDASGNAIAAWVHADTPINNVYAAVYNAATNTWSAAVPIDGATNASNPANTAGNSLQTSINGSRAVVAWQHNQAASGSVYDSWVARYDGTTFQPAQNVESLPANASQQSVAIDNLGNIAVAYQQSDGVNTNVYVNRFNIGSGTWAGPVVRDTVTSVASDPRIAFDSNGNGVLIYRASSNVYAQTYTRSTDSWGPQTTLDSLTTTPTALTLALDANGTGFAAWVQSDTSGASVYAARFNGTSWAAAVPIDGPAAQTGDTPVNTSTYSLVLSVSGNRAALMWQQDQGASTGIYDLQVARFDGTSWSTADVIEQRTETAGQPSIAIDSLGNVTAAFMQNDGTANSAYVARYNMSAASSYFVVPAGATWQSIANTVYGVNSAAAGSALQAALPGQTLATNVQLGGFPTSLGVLTTVPTYYRIVAGDTWAIVAQKVYGTSDANAIAQMQSFAGTTTLPAVGQRLNVQTTLTYTPSGGGGPVVYQRTEVLDALGATMTYRQDSSGRLISVQRASSSGTLETRYDYDAATGNLWHIIEDPTGLNRVTTFEYDANTGLLLTTRDPLGNTITRTYNSNNQLSTETAYTAPDPDGTGAAQPGGPMVTRYVYDAENHLRFMVSADGRVTEHQYNTDGLRVLTFNHLAATYGGVYDETSLANWTTGAGAGVRERIDYRYDWRGNIDRITRWETTDAAGVGTGASSLTQFVYDQRGQLLQRIDPRGSGTAANASTPNENQAFATTYLYDGLGRVQRAVEWLDGPEIATGRTLRTRVRTTTYDDLNRYTTVQLVGGLSTLSVFDRAGALVRVEAAGIVSARYAYDAGGRLRIATDASDVRQFSFYDSANRLVGTVDGDGTVTELIYDKASQLIKTVRHSTLLSSATLATLVDGSGNPTAVTFGSLLTQVGTTDATDKITRRVYDNAGRLVYSLELINSVGELYAVTKFTYDGANRLVEELHYRNTVSIARATDQVLPSAITVSAHADDRLTRHFFDNSGNCIATLDGEGFLTENTYDNAGHLITRLARANPVAVGLRATGTLAQLQTSAGTDTETTTDPEVDITTQYYYDMQGRLAGVLDGESYFTRTNYNVAGNVLSTVRYRNKTNLTGRPALSTIQSAVSAMPSHTTARQYDAAGRLLSEVDFESTRTEYEYDNLDNVVSLRTAAATSDERYALAKYDDFGRVIRELSGEGRDALVALPGNATQAQIDDVWNRFGVLYGYDNAGRRTTATIRPNATQTLVTRYYYDNDGRLRFEVNQLGERKEYRYDAFGQLTDEIKYFNTISTSGLNGGLLTTALLGTLTGNADATRDAKTSHIYTLRGQVSNSQTMELATVARTYNTFGELDSQTLGTGFAANTFTYTHRGQLAETFRNGVSFEKREYDAFGRLTKVTDGRGKISRTEYDRLGRTIATVDPFNLRSTIDYDGYSRVIQTDDATAGSNFTVYTYDDVALTTTVDTPAGVRVVTTHNRQNETWKVTVAATANPTVILDSKEYLYNKNGALRYFYDDGTKVEERTYDQGGRLETTIDTRGTTTRIEYDAASRVYREIVDSVSGGLQLTTTHVYDGQGRLTDVTDARGTLTRTSYDRDGRVVEVAVDPNGLNLRTRYAYDTRNNTTLVTEGYGTSLPRRTRYVYDNLGRRIEEIVDPTVDGGTLNLRTQYKYDNNDNMTRKIDSRGFSCWYVYDDKNRLTHKIDALGGVTYMTYDEVDRLASTRHFVSALSAANLSTLASLDAPTTATFTMPANSTNDRFDRSFYDKDGREKYSIDGLGVVTQRDYDALGQVTRLRVLSGPRLTGTYANTDAVTAALGTAADTLAVLDRVTWNTYDTLGRLEWTIDSMNGTVGGVQRLLRDGNGNVIEMRRYATARTLGLATDLATMRNWGSSNSDATVDQFTRFWFDRADRARFTLDAEGYLTEIRYNDANRTTTSIAYYPLQTGVRNLASGADVSLVPGVVLTDAARDEVTVRWSDAVGRTRLMRDAEGYVTQTRYNDQTGAQETIGYAEKPTSAPNEGTALNTALGYLVTTAARDRRSMSWIDAAGRQRFTVDGEGYAVETRYDDVTGTQRVIRYAQSLPPNYTLSISDTLSTANTTLTALSDVFQQTTRTNVDNVGRVSSVTRAEGSSDVVTEYYGYDAAGNKTRFTNARGSALGDAAYTWDYTYDANGNLLTEVTPNVDVHTVTADASTITVSNAVATRITTKFEYDFLGNVITKYDAFGHAQQRATTYEYDAMGRQVRTFFPVVPVYNPTAGDTNYGTGGVIGPNETTPGTISSETWYDALGNAFRSRDVTGNYSYKTYDRMGRVQYEIGARVEGVSAAWNQNYVTLHVYDAFGNQTGLTRYANPLAAQPSTTASSLRSSQISITSSTADRTITTTYDRRNLATQVTQASLANNFWRAANTTSGALFTDAATSYTTYNAFGEAVRSWSRVSNTASADTYSYYDRRGYKTAQIDPLGYLTKFKYDASGDVVEQTEFARPITGAYDIRTYTDAPLTPYTLGVGAAGTEQGFDRTTIFTYDVLNRRKSIAEQNVEYTGFNGQVLDPRFETLTTSFGYDALGNQISVTDALNNTTYTYYDVLGRTIATVAPGRTVETGSSVRPATRFFRDAHGNVVKQVEYKLDVTGTLVNNVLPTFNVDANDRVTRMQYDLQGRVIRTEDANDVDRFTSYYADGAIAKEWMVVHNLLDPLTSTDDRHESLVTIYKYDAQGQQIETKSPVSLDNGQVIRTTKSVYNAFGEIVSKGTIDSLSPSGDQEFFDYDVTGRIWRTNSGDGVTRIMLYDLAGQATVEFRSQTVNLRSYATLADFITAYNASPSSFMRTETVYNARGKVIERYAPTYRINNYGLPPVAADIFIGTLAGSPAPGHVYLYWAGAQQATVDEVFEYRVPNGAWTSVTPVDLPGGYLGVDVHALRNQDYQYRIAYRRTNQAASYAESSGTFRVNISQSTTISNITQGSLTDSDSIGTLSIVSTAPQPTNTVTFDTALWSQPGPPGSNFLWVGANVVHATFANVGLSSVRAVIQFYRRTQGNGQGSFITFDNVVGTAVNQAEIHVQLDQATYFTSQEGGILQVYRVQIFTADGATLLRDSRPELAPVGLVWAAPTDQTVTAIFRYKRSIDPTFSTDQPVTRLGSQFAINVFPLLTQNTTYDYEVEYRRAGVAIAKKAGQMTSNGEVVNHSHAGTVSSTATDGFNQAIGTPTISGLTMSWAPPTDNLDPTFEAAYAFNATFEWGTTTAYGNTNISVNRPGSGNWSVDLTGIPTPSVATTYYYRTRYTIGSRVVAEQTGNFQISAPSTSTSITANSNGPQPTVVPPVATVSGSSGVLTATTTFETALWRQPGPPGSNFLWVGANVVHATFANVGLSSVRAVIQVYRRTQGNGQGSLITFDNVVGTAVNQAEIHVQLDQATYFTTQEGGILQVYRVQIFNGTTLLRDSWASGGTAGPPKLTWNAPDPALNLSARITVNGSTTNLTPSGGVFTHSLGSLNGSFAYLIEYFRPGETTAIVAQSGTVTTDTVSCSVSNVSAINRNATWIAVSALGASLSWSQAAQTAGDVSFRYRQVGSGTWLTDLSPPASTGPNFSITFPNAAAGTIQYEYEVRYIRSGETLPYVYSTGTATVVRTSNSSTGTFGSKTDSVWRMQQVPVDATLTGDVFRWNYALASGSSVTFRYRINGGTENSVTFNSGGPQFQTQLASLPIGNSTVTWWIEYRYPGQAPYAAASGSVAASHTTTTTQANNVSILTQNAQYPTVYQIATPVNLGNGSLGWSTATLANTTVTVRYRINGGSWQTTSSGFSAYGSGVQRQFAEAGSYEYELTYQQSGQPTPYAKTNGTFSVAVSDNAPSLMTRTIDGPKAQGLFVGSPRIEPTPTPIGPGGIPNPLAIWSTVAAPIPYYIPIVSASPNSYIQTQPSSAAGPATYSAVSGITVAIHAQLKWMANANVDTEMLFEYRVLGSTGSYTQLGVYLLNAGDTLGVDIDPLAANTYEYRLTYKRSGAAAPYATATGRFVRGTGLLDNSVTVDAPPALPVEDANPVIKQTLDRWGNVLQVQDQAGQLTNYRYDQRSQLVTTTAPSMTYLDTRVTVATTLPSARPVSYNYYDKLGRVIATKDPNGNETRFVYNAAGQMTSRQNADSAAHTGGAFVYNTYNTFGNLVQVEDEMHFKTRNFYDKRNQITETWREIVANTMPVWSATTPEASMQRHAFTYDEAGRRIVEVNGEYETLRYGYDLAGNLSLRLTPFGSRTQYTYDVHGRKATEIQMLDVAANIYTQLDWLYDYFGRLRDHIGMRLVNSSDETKWGNDLRTDYDYFYNQAGQLYLQTSSGGQNISYSFDAAGQVTLIQDSGANRRTDYTYDAAGRRIRERVSVGNLVHQDTRITYDSHGRIATLDDPDYRVSYSYDLAGNRTLIRSNYVNFAKSPIEEYLYYRYDQMNRVEISQGMLNPTTREVQILVPSVGYQGYRLVYNARGDRIQMTERGNKWVQNGNEWSAPWLMQEFSEYYKYDGLGRLLKVEVDKSDGGRQTRREYTLDREGRARFEWTYSIITVNAQPTGYLEVRKVDTLYDADGRVSSQTTRTKKNEQADGSYKLQSIVRMGTATYADHYGNSALEWGPGYDKAGNLRGYDVEVHTGSSVYTTHNTYTFDLGESFLTRIEAATSTGDEPRPANGSVTRYYNANEELIAAIDAVGTQKSRAWVNNQAGQVLTTFTGVVNPSPDANQATWDSAIAYSSRSSLAGAPKAQYFFFANDQMVGSVGALQHNPQQHWRGNFDVNYTPVSGEYPGTQPQFVVAVYGDTLRTIASRVYGDGNLWYVLADENGLNSPDELIAEGTTIRVPNSIISLSNAGNVFKPYDPSNAIGDLTPTQPIPPAPRMTTCQFLALIVVIIVTVIVAYYTGGAVADALPSAWGWFGAAIGGAVGGAVGSAAGQGVGIMLGLQEDFDWKQVATAAVLGFVTAGLGGLDMPAGTEDIPGLFDKLGKMGAFGKGATEVINKITGVLGKSFQPVLQAGLKAAAIGAISQRLLVATDLKDKFSWRDVAASTVGAMVGKGVGIGLDRLPNTPAVVKDTLTGLAGGLSSAVVSGGKIDFASIAVDAFGNALGNESVRLIDYGIAVRHLAAARKLSADGMLMAANVDDPRSLVTSRNQQLYEQQLALLREGLGEYAKYVGILRGSNIDQLEALAKKEKGYLGVQGRGQDPLAELMVSLGFVPESSTRTISMFGATVTNLEFTPAQVAATWKTVQASLDSGLKGTDDDLIERMVLFVRNEPNVTTSDIYKAVLNVIGGYAQPAVYGNVEKQVLALQGSRGVIDVSFGYTQSMAGATLSAASTPAVQDALRLRRESNEQILRNDSYWMGVNPAGGAPPAVQNAIMSVHQEQFAMTAEFALDPLAPADLRNGARTSLFIDVALQLAGGAGAAIKGIKALRQARTMARLTGLQTMERLELALQTKTVAAAEDAATVASREFQVALKHRVTGNSQVIVNGQRWNVPKEMTPENIPTSDAVGDSLQNLASDAGRRWNPVRHLSLDEREAIARAREQGEYWQANLLEKQAKGRWVEKQVKMGAEKSGLKLDWSRRGADVVDPSTGLKYDILSGTKSNIDVHARRMYNELFRFITF